MTTLLASPVVDDATRREFLALLSAAGLLTGCATEEGRADGGQTRTVRHDAGVTEVPVTPMRVVTTALPSDLLALGLRPVGVGFGWSAENERRLGYHGVEVDLDGIPIIEGSGGPDLEAIAALRPDLIIARVSDTYPTLSGIAPTILFELNRVADAEAADTTTWQQVAGRVAAAISREDELAALEATLDAAVADLAARARPGTRVSLVRDNGDSFRIDGAMARYRPLATAGLDIQCPLDQVPADAIRGNGALIQLSYERLDLVTGDVIVVPGEEDRIALERQPLWATLPAVRAGRVIAPPAPRAYLCFSYPEAVSLLRALANDPKTANVR